MLRLIGILILIAAGIWCGLAVRRAERSRIALLASSVALIQHTRRKIDLFETPTAELFVDFSEGFDEKTRRSLIEKPLTVALRPIIATLGSDGDALEKFAREIGSGYKTDAMRLCDYCLAVMENRHAAAVGRYGTHKKLYIVLPLLFAFSVIVLLL
ncbi:MAG: hypothetical protein J6S41_05865 [Clostridia bacterium]|nr:hypothetical protein [Clostridia bacterium]